MILVIAFSFLSISFVIISMEISAWSIGLMLVIPLLGSLAVIKAQALTAGGFQSFGSRIYISGIPIDSLSLKETVRRMDNFIRSSGWGRIVVTPDTTSLMRARSDPKIKDIYRRADLVTADGIGIVWASKFLGAPIPERVTGIDTIHELCKRSAKKGYRLFLLGGREEVASKAKTKLVQKFPGLNIVGAHHGFFDRVDEVIRKITKAKPDVLLVGMGFPKQEKWVVKNIDRTGASIAMGVGGSFDVISGEVPRAPETYQKLGLEWFYRLLIEPRRIGRSIYIPLFVLNILLLKILRLRDIAQKSGTTLRANFSFNGKSRLRTFRSIIHFL